MRTPGSKEGLHPAVRGGLGITAVAFLAACSRAEVQTSQTPIPDDSSQPRSGEVEGSLAVTPTAETLWRAEYPDVSGLLLLIGEPFTTAAREGEEGQRFAMFINLTDAGSRLYLGEVNGESETVSLARLAADQFTRAQGGYFEFYGERFSEAGELAVDEEPILRLRFETQEGIGGPVVEPDEPNMQVWYNGEWLDLFGPSEVIEEIRRGYAGLAALAPLEASKPEVVNLPQVQTLEVSYPELTNRLGESSEYIGTQGVVAGWLNRQNEALGKPYTLSRDNLEGLFGIIGEAWTTTWRFSANAQNGEFRNRIVLLKDSEGKYVALEGYYEFIGEVMELAQSTDKPYDPVEPGFVSLEPLPFPEGYSGEELRQRMISVAGKGAVEARTPDGKLVDVFLIGEDGSGHWVVEQGGQIMVGGKLVAGGEAGVEELFPDVTLAEFSPDEIDWRPEDDELLRNYLEPLLKQMGEQNIYLSTGLHQPFLLGKTIAKIGEGEEMVWTVLLRYNREAANGVKQGRFLLVVDANGDVVPLQEVPQFLASGQQFRLQILSRPPGIEEGVQAIVDLGDGRFGIGVFPFWSFVGRPLAVLPLDQAVKFDELTWIPLPLAEVAEAEEAGEFEPGQVVDTVYRTEMGEIIRSDHLDIRKLPESFFGEFRYGYRMAVEFQPGAQYKWEVFWDDGGTDYLAIWFEGKHTFPDGTVVPVDLYVYGDELLFNSSQEREAARQAIERGESPFAESIDKEISSTYKTLRADRQTSVDHIVDRTILKYDEWMNYGDFLKMLEGIGGEPKIFIVEGYLSHKTKEWPQLVEDRVGLLVLLDKLGLGLDAEAADSPPPERIRLAMIIGYVVAP